MDKPLSLKKQRQNAYLEKRRKTRGKILVYWQYIRPKRVTQKDMLEFFSNTKYNIDTENRTKRFKTDVWEIFYRLLIKDLIELHIEYEITNGAAKDVLLKIGFIEKFLGKFFFKEHLKFGDKNPIRHVVRIGCPEKRKEKVFYHKVVTEFNFGENKSKRFKKSLWYKCILSSKYHKILKKYIKETNTSYSNNFIALQNG
jgi:hypothetical protein